MHTAGARARRARSTGHNRDIDDGTQDPDEGTSLSAGQDELPFPVMAGARRAGRMARLDAVVTASVLAAGSAVRHRPARAASAVVAFVLRWAVRVSFPLAGAAAMLHLFPYRATALGVHFRIEGTLLTRSGLSADTTFGNWEFPRVDGLPIGAHISPENVDVVKLASTFSQNGQFYVDGLRSSLQSQLPVIVGWLVGEVLVGVLLGLAAAALLNLAGRYLRQRPRRRHELRIRTAQLAAAFGVVVLLGGYGALTFNPDWPRQSRVTGTLATLQLFPGQLDQYYTQQSKFFDVIHAIAGIQSQLQQHIEQTDSQPTSFNIMFISDMHLAGTYPLVAQYAANFDVSLIINTGDESEFGTTAEMTSAYLAQLRAVTAKVPMIWMAGNHDSPATVQVMRSIPGVTVVGEKTAQPDSSGFAVTAQQLSAFGLTVAAVPDPRVYGGTGAFGSNDDNVVDPLEQQTMDGAVQGVPKSAQFDIFATHEPVAADRLVHDLPGQIRQANSGHLHAQNPDSAVQRNGLIDLVEGSTGAGGLDNINRGVPAPPVEFSIESVAASCQFTKVVRFQLAGPPPDASVEQSSGQQVTASTIYLKPQQVASGRTCTVDQGLTDVRDVGPAS